MLRVEQLEIATTQKVLVRNLSFELTMPTFVAIVGHNGCGKTSLLKAIANLLPYKGEIFLSAETAYLQQQNSLQFDIPSSELAVMGKFSQKKILNPYSLSDFEETKDIFQKLGIDNLYNENARLLSGGELQLVWLAQVLLQDQPIILLDEPTHYLDVRNKKLVFTILQKLVIEKNKLILCVTHDLLNLFSCTGYLLNLSAPEPVLETINEETIRKTLLLLEQ